MYNVVKSVINTGNFELAEMLKKIDVIWLQGSLSDKERAELIKLAQDNADPGMSVDVLKRLEDHETRLRKLEEGGSQPQPSEEYPRFETGKSYRNGDKCSENGKNYVCQLPEYVDVCVWAPSAYPAYWKEVI